MNNKQSDLKGCLEQEDRKKQATDAEHERILLENQIEIQRRKNIAEILDAYEKQKDALKMEFERQLLIEINLLYEGGFAPESDEFQNAKREIILRTATSSTLALEQLQQEKDELLKPLQK
jgi:hypothetical protein